MRIRLKKGESNHDNNNLRRRRWLHLITGRCIAVDAQFHRAEADGAFGYDTILSDDAVRFGHREI